MTFSSDGKTFYVAASGDDRIEAWDAHSHDASRRSIPAPTRSASH